MSNIQIYHVSKNLFDGTTSETNKRISITTGGSYSSNGYSISKYIPINPNTAYIVNTSYSSFYALYDINKIYIYGGSTNDSKPTINTYSNAAFIRFDFQTDDISTMMFNAGTTTLPYEPYSADVWHDLAPQQYINGVFVDSTNIPEKYSGGSWG